MEFVKKAVKICEDRQAEKINVIDLRGFSVLTDFCIVCSGNSIAHISAITRQLEKSFKDYEILPRNIEGTPASLWVIMDYNDVLIHILHHDTRVHYNFEQLLKSSAKELCY